VQMCLDVCVKMCVCRLTELTLTVWAGAWVENTDPQSRCVCRCVCRCAQMCV